MSVEHAASPLLPVVILLTAGVLAVPIFKRLGLGAVLGYFSAGILIGPHVFGFFDDPQQILHLAELGVVMFLFIIGLEMRPSKLWQMRGQIFGLGAAQVVLCCSLLTLLGVAVFDLSWPVAFVGGAGFVLSSTAVVMQMLAERGESNTPAGQQALSILLLEDLAIVPLLAIVAFISPNQTADSSSQWAEIALALGALAALIIAGKWLLNPLFAILAASRAREVMTAAALLVVLGAALLMEISGLSMAMGAFLAGVLLSESSYRHQIEADIEPFKGILLGLFFLAVGMSLNLSIIATQWVWVALAVITFMLTKAMGIYVIARLFKSNNRQALLRTAMFAQGGEFAFVLYAAAVTSGLMDMQTNALLSATVILSMALTPMVMIAVDRLLPAEKISADGLDKAENLQGQVLVIGFGRFGQIASQVPLSRGFELAIIDNDPIRIREAAKFGRHIYFGDGTQLDILHTSGAAQAQAIMICVDDKQAVDHIVDLAQHSFPNTKLITRAWDRRHYIELLNKGVDYVVRETAAAAFELGEKTLSALGVDKEEAERISHDIRLRDSRLLCEQVSAGIDMQQYSPKPQPLTETHIDN
ncbi:potassium transporter [Testudinibacter sp. TR-2022]|uniref:monovalent cation:proton antiporter-2 (CPA2) family protein n=1 Tax=Testudinibacter sp. TR-2022 TaxID=2585029 RepID=UPI00111A26D5|nr:monovalent cation:proton antiporter-2 (CPA2) family protein [Testudinibacter sp. TR-2022]TNH03878.1 potassium transporter [Pasteurellaceae bacterium Phil31]TNH07674.1 potassium transporter [Testudinibacter sp. TR-2022]TNH08768.1 potassium transporter [Testudinibacter sp. TR-2022]TNH10780.1 potassium transporter [Testudinibacter sp. TR-2022]TNH18370.1 potassium transporter [Testudinibacter sp. TR-2022]